MNEEQKYPIININGKDLICCHQHAKKACIGGKSNIHKNYKDRAKKLLTDNFIGQIGNLAGCIFLYGEDRGREEYNKSREEANKNPFSGDGGRDIIGKDIDIKCSYMRNSKNPASYNMLVRPREYHKNWTYIQTLADRNDKSFDVHIVGWASTDDLPEETETYGPFEGAYKLSVKKLKDMKTLDVG